MRVPGTIAFHDLGHVEEKFRDAVLDGLTAPAKHIPCKFLYDARGSALFDQICELPEYYPTRTEMRLLRHFGGEIAATIGPGAQIVEFGSGASRKSRILLDALDRPQMYVPIDVSRQHLRAAAEALARDYGELEIMAICGDYTRTVPLPPPGPGRRVGFFPGSTIGNFKPAEAEAFLVSWRDRLSGGGMLVGVDLKKDAGLLHAAYNDAAGVTAAFNLNLLARINRELAGDFDLAAFAHVANWDAAEGRIVIYIESRREQVVHAAGRSVRFAAGERIHTEDSYKYTIDEFRDLARAAGYRPQRVWSDAQQLFSLHYLSAL
ncbi:MAG TPA: L-histidine N(alpha)-methyltransferase [Candidatus Sulfotelmatobacter sp.]|nr:L-histidine N(alpha)-methyltransferase [Candidatus Sulfotelmatobacter sp.]